MGEELRALIVADGDPETVDLGEIAAWMRGRLTAMKCPRRYEVVPDLLRNTMGKINKRALRDAYLEGRL
jgi:long-chain acyl-CoA synthetase